MINSMRKSTFASYLDQFKRKHASDFETESIASQEKLEQKVDEEVKLLYEEFETFKKLRDLQNTQQYQQQQSNRPVSRLLKSKFSNPKSSPSTSTYFVVPSRLDSIQNGCNQVKEKLNSLKKRMDYSKKIAQIHANFWKNKIPTKESAEMTKSNCLHANEFMIKRLGKGNRNSNLDKEIPSPSSQDDEEEEIISKNQHCCATTKNNNNNTKIMMKNPQFIATLPMIGVSCKPKNMTTTMTTKVTHGNEQKQKWINGKGNSSASSGGSSSNESRSSSTKNTEIKSQYCRSKSTGLSLDYDKFDESKLEEMRMRHELRMQYVNKLAEEMKL